MKYKITTFSWLKNSIFVFTIYYKARHIKTCFNFIFSEEVPLSASVFILLYFGAQNKVTRYDSIDYRAYLYRISKQYHHKLLISCINNSSKTWSGAFSPLSAATYERTNFIMVSATFTRISKFN